MLNKLKELRSPKDIKVAPTMSTTMTTTILNSQFKQQRNLLTIASTGNFSIFISISCSTLLNSTKILLCRVNFPRNDTCSCYCSNNLDRIYLDEVGSLRIWFLSQRNDPKSRLAMITDDDDDDDDCGYKEQEY